MTMASADVGRPMSAPGGACPACRSDDLRFLVELEAPIHTSKLLATHEEAIGYPRGTVRLELCGACGVITNSRFDAEHHDYSASYEETQAYSPRFVDYASALVHELVERYSLEDADVLEIGCGRGDVLLLLAGEAGGRAIGIEPSWKDDLPESPASDRITIVPEFLQARHLDRDLGLVVCRHTLEHVHDVLGFLRTIANGLDARPSTPLFFEVPDTGRVLRETAFWDIYYEHCSYFTPGSMARAFRAAGLAPTRLRLGFDDQYIQLDAKLGSEGTTLPLEDSAEDVAEEAAAFVARLEDTRALWRRRFEDADDRGEVVVMWGAGSKGVGFLAALGDVAGIACVVDVNPAKHGMFMPGTGHEIVPPAALVALEPDLVVVMNPAYEDEIRAMLADLGVRATVTSL